MTDTELFELLKDISTREKGFSVLVHDFKERVYWQIRHMVLSHEDSNDLVQEVFIKVFQNIDSFKGDSTLSTWIYRIALNHTLNFLSSKRQRYRFKFTSIEDAMFESLKSDTSFEADEIELKLQKAILLLPDKQRLVFNLRYYDEMPFKEMEQILETTESSLKATYHFAAKKIKEQLLKDEIHNFDFPD
ncbi:MAG: sigma-70 family RNA polymerase sigma factor [Bacteroidales bacterium]|nr:sigma-70 family RNA polymerase sigma factor [Bacteroidales bacterium]MDD4684511.1 sigma-70 family RNA polymerase sigma factor [Bacteroidales bacterium]